MIFKVQRPLASNAQELYCLVYDEHRKHEFHVPYTPELGELFGLHNSKIYVEGSYVNKELIIEEVVDDQDW